MKNLNDITYFTIKWKSEDLLFTDKSDEWLLNSNY